MIQQTQLKVILKYHKEVYLVILCCLSSIQWLTQDTGHFEVDCSLVSNSILVLQIT